MYYDNTNYEFNENIHRLEEFYRLTDDWDGYGSKAPNAILIGWLRGVLPRLLRQPDIFPTSDGEIQLEYFIPNHKHLNIEIHADMTMSIFEMFDKNSATTDDYTLDYSIINERIKKFYGD